MAKMVRCKTCGAEIAKNAKVCPQCGAKNKKHTLLGIILVVVGILLIGAAVSGGGDKNEPKKAPSNESSDASTVSTAPEASEQEKTVFSVGETVELKDVKATLLSVTSNKGSSYNTPTEGNDFVICEFEIENGTDHDIAVSTMMSFNCYFDDYAANLSIGAITSANATQLDGTIAGGKKMKGVVGYEAPEDWKELEIHYSPSFWGKEIVFTATHE